MVYLFYGTENFFIDQEIQKLKKQYQIEDINMSHYDFDHTSIDEILEDANTFSLFETNKMIIVDHMNLFSNVVKKTVSDEDIKKLEEYLLNFNPNTHLIFKNDKVNQTKKITKLVKQKGVLKDCSTTTNLSNIVKDLCAGYDIDSAAILELTKRVGNNVFMLQQECQKLKSYKIEEKKITVDDIKELVHKTLDLDIFHFIDTIIHRKKEEAMEIYEEMLLYNEEPIKIIVMLANQFRLMYQAKIMSKKGYREADIAKELNVHPYPVKLALQKSREYNTERLLAILDELSCLDYQIKSGKIEKKLALDLFILGL